jgi:excinuclease ABC subunit C
MPQATITKLQIEQLPEKTGVYIFKGDHTVLYVGKAANIKKRIQNHFQAAKTDQREKRIIESTDRIDYIVTDTETEALIEENVLIKAYKPRHNVRLSDDKTYPYIKIDTKEDFPCLSITRKTTQTGAKYFGPYGDVGAMRNSLKTITRIFPVRTCKKPIDAPAKRPCIYYHIGRCSAPCAARVSRQEYDSMVNGLILFLEGKMNGVIQNLRSEMSAASLRQEYEKAASLRDRITDLERTVQTVRVVLPSNENLDAIVLYRGKGGVCTQVLQVREGKILASENFNLKAAEDADDQETLESFLKQYYLRRTYIPNKLILNKRIGDSAIADWLSEKSGKRTVIKKPSDVKLKAILNLASENARTYLEQLDAARKKAANSLFELRSILGLKKVPKAIECFDISNLGEREAVGSKIAFLDGMPNKKEYRMYRIRTVFRQDDQAMIGEIVRRRFTRLLKEGRILPDLVVVDGGITQVRAAKRQLDELAVTAPVIGLAKRLEQIYLPDGRILEPHRNSASSLLLQHIRNEAHRFAVKYHRKRIEKTEVS